MIFSRSSQYAIQAMVYLASHSAGSYVLTRNMAADLGIPKAYLAKLLHRLVQAGLVFSVRGRLGGFRLARQASQLGVMDIVVTVEGEGLKQDCLLGLKKCSDETACAMHKRWRPIKEDLCRILEEHNLDKLVQAIGSGRSHLGALPLAGLTPTKPGPSKD